MERVKVTVSLSQSALRTDSANARSAQPEAKIFRLATKIWASCYGRMRTRRKKRCDAGLPRGPKDGKADGLLGGGQELLKTAVSNSILVSPPAPAMPTSCPPPPWECGGVLAECTCKASQKL